MTGRATHRHHLPTYTHTSRNPFSSDSFSLLVLFFFYCFFFPPIPFCIIVDGLCVLQYTPQTYNTYRGFTTSPRHHHLHRRPGIEVPNYSSCWRTPENPTHRNGTVAPTGFLIFVGGKVDNNNNTIMCTGCPRSV